MANPRLGGRGCGAGLSIFEALLQFAAQILELNGYAT
jgi:hypothetical protein